MFPRTATIATAALLALACGARVGAQDSRYWALTPYKVRVLVAAETTTLPSGGIARRVAAHLSERCDTAIGPIWKLSIETLTGDSRLQALRGHSDEQLLAIASEEESPADKLMMVTIRESSTGIRVQGAEVDTLLARVGRPQTATPASLGHVAESSFELICDLFSPLALFKVDREKGNVGTISLRGSKLPTRVGAPEWVKPNDVLLPILRRTNREGEVTENGLLSVPWTYLLVGDEQTDDGLISVNVASHSKRPFGVRRRGRVEQYGILLHPRESTTRVYLHAKDNPDQPLSGYNAFVQDGDKDERTPIGASDADGMLTIKRGDSPIQMVFIKSGSQVVAKAPVPAGAIDQIEIALLDERARLEAEAKLSLLREELIDLVARRTILEARIEDLIAKKKKAEARELLAKLDGMPGRAQFNQKLTRIQQQSKSDNPTVQARIDRQFAETAAVLGAFLGIDKVRELRAKLSGA